MTRRGANDDAKRLTASPSLTRRDLFEFAGLAMAAAALPTKMPAAAPPSHADPQQNVSSIMERLSVYMSEAGSRSLPAEVMEKTKQHILDTLAAMSSGSELPPGRTALQFARAYGGREVATVVASNFACGPIGAALTNGVLAHAAEPDASHPPSQSPPGCPLGPPPPAPGAHFCITVNPPLVPLA